MIDKLFAPVSIALIIVILLFTHLNIEKNDKIIRDLQFENHNLKMNAQKDSVIINGLIELKKENNYSLTKMSKNDLYERFKAN